MNDNITLNWKELAQIIDSASYNIFEKMYHNEKDPGYRELCPVICNKDELEILIEKLKK